MSKSPYYELVSQLPVAFPTLPLDSPPWILASDVPGAIKTIAESGDLGEFSATDDAMFIHHDAVVEDGAILRGPVVVCAGCRVSASAYLRGGVILGPDTHVGSSVELKSTIVAGSSAIAHLSYVGNSVLGSHVNLEAGVVIANHLNETPGTTVVAKSGNMRIQTGLMKFGALVGDFSKVGANSVLSPGTILDPRTIVPRLTLV